MRIAFFSTADGQLASEETIAGRLALAHRYTLSLFLGIPLLPPALYEVRSKPPLRHHHNTPFPFLCDHIASFRAIVYTRRPQAHIEPKAIVADLQIRLLLASSVAMSRSLEMCPILLVTTGRLSSLHSYEAGTSECTV